MITPTEPIKRGRPRLQVVENTANENTEEIQDAEVIQDAPNRPLTEPEDNYVSPEPERYYAAPEPETVTDSGGTKINFMNDSNADEIFKRRAEAYTPPIEEQPEYTVDAETVSSQINPPKPAITAAELEDISQFAIEMIDSFASFGFSKLSGDETTEKYELPTSKKRKLSDMLAIILEKRNLGNSLSIEMLFFVTLVLAYAPMAKKALDQKKRNESSGKNRGSIR
jgi:hypothetical protein